MAAVFLERGFGFELNDGCKVFLVEQRIESLEDQRLVFSYFDWFINRRICSGSGARRPDFTACW